MLSFKLYHHHAFNDFKLLGDVDQIVSFDSRHPTIPTWGGGWQREQLGRGHVWHAMFISQVPL